MPGILLNYAILFFASYFLVYFPESYVNFVIDWDDSTADGRSKSRHDRKCKKNYIEFNIRNYYAVDSLATISCSLVWSMINHTKIIILGVLDARPYQRHVRGKM